MTEEKLGRIIELLCAYGRAKFGADWWPAKANTWLTKDEGGEELVALLKELQGESSWRT
jgi:hypothetical protein